MIVERYDPMNLFELVQPHTQVIRRHAARCVPGAVSGARVRIAGILLTASSGM